MSPYRRAEDVIPPAPQRMSDVAIMRFEHIFEVDPALMTEHVPPAGLPELGHAADRREPARPPGVDAPPLGHRRRIRRGAAG